MKIAQEQLGHASISTTLNIYTHVVEASHRTAIEAVERQLFPSFAKSPEVDTKEDGKCQCVNTLGLEAPPGFEPGREVLQTLTAVRNH